MLGGRASVILIPYHVFSTRQKSAGKCEALVTYIYRNENVTQNRGAKGRLFTLKKP